MSTYPLDCILVGYNDVNLQAVVNSTELMAKVSGALRNMLHNTVSFHGKRMNYTTLLNTILTEATGKDYDLHVMQLPNLGVAYLKSFLIRNGLNVEAVNFFNREKEWLATLVEGGARVVVITTTFYVGPEPIIEIIKYVRRIRPETIIIVGGPHIFNVCNDQDIATQNYYFKKLGADILIYESQGEAALTRVLHELRKGRNQDLSQIPNLIYKKETQTGGIKQSGDALLSVSGAKLSERFIRTPKETENNSLDENMIDWSLFQQSYYTPTVQMRTARSCAFKCAFCSYPVMAGPLSLMSLEVIEREMSQLKENGVKSIIFIDDTFNVPLARYKKILKMMIRNKFEFNWVSYFRCSNSDEESFDLMAESGCRGVFLGIESGDDEMLLKMNKLAAVEKYESGINSLNARGIITFVSLIVGFPGETRKSVEVTMDFITRTCPTFYRAELYYHSNHLPIQKQATQYGIRGGGYSWQHDTMDWQKACDLIDLMYKSINSSIILPEYMFDFWSIPYLLGKGIKKEHIIEFAKLSQSLLVDGLDNSVTINVEDLHHRLGLLSRRIIEDLE